MIKSSAWEKSFRFDTQAVVWTVLLGWWAVGLSTWAQESVSEAVSSSATPTSPVSQDHEVVKSYEADMGDHKIIFHRVKPPVSRPKAAVITVPSEPSPEVLAQIEEHKTGQRQSLLLTGTVYDHQVTELIWSHGERAYRAFSNIDFDQLCCNFELLKIEEGDRVYEITKVINNETTESRARINRARLEQGQPALPVKWIPAPGDFPSDRSAYMLVDRGGGVDGEGEPTDDELRMACAGIDAIHRYYDAHKEEVIAKWQERLTAQEAASMQAAQRQPKPKRDTVIYFWRKSRQGAEANAENNFSGESK